MRIGIPTEVKDNEYRVAITPAGVHELVGRGHEVFVQSGAGLGSSLPDEEYEAAGAKLLGSAEEVWGQAELLLKVKEPVAAEYGFLWSDLVLSTSSAPGRGRTAHPRTGRGRHHGRRLRDGPRPPVPAARHRSVLNRPEAVRSAAPPPGDVNVQ